MLKSFKEGKKYKVLPWGEIQKKYKTFINEDGDLTYNEKEPMHSVYHNCPFFKEDKRFVGDTVVAEKDCERIDLENWTGYIYPFMVEELKTYESKFELGETYRVKTLEELKYTDGVYFDYDRDLVNKNQGGTFIAASQAPTMLDICKKVFVATSENVNMINNWRVSPWMCEKVEEESRTITLDEAVKIRKGGVVEGTFKNPNKEKVDHPSHYVHGGVEAIDVIEAWGLNFNLGNIIKYISRCGFKDDEVQELEKAKWYINREIERRVKNER